MKTKCKIQFRARKSANFRKLNLIISQNHFSDFLELFLDFFFFFCFRTTTFVNARSLTEYFYFHPGIFSRFLPSSTGFWNFSFFCFFCFCFSVSLLHSTDCLRKNKKFNFSRIIMRVFFFSLWFWSSCFFFISGAQQRKTFFFFLGAWASGQKRLKIFQNFILFFLFNSVRSASLTTRAENAIFVENCDRKNCKMQNYQNGRPTGGSGNCFCDFENKKIFFL